MKVLKLVLGVLCIALCVVVLFQSCAATALNALEDEGEVDGIGGIFVALLMLTGGILYTVGAVLYGVGKKVKYMHSVFHLFVVAGSILQFLSIILYAL